MALAMIFVFIFGLLFVIFLIWVWPNPSDKVPTKYIIKNKEKGIRGKGFFNFSIGLQNLETAYSFILENADTKEKTQKEVDAVTWYDYEIGDIIYF